MSSSQPGSLNRRVLRSNEKHLKITRLRVRNSRLPIYRLPPELLNLAFLYVRDGVDYHGQSYAILVLSWVSFHWREITLSNSLLWTFVDLLNEDVINLFLTRSLEANLSIDLEAGSPDDFVPISQAIGRVESLELMCPEFDEDEGESMHDDPFLRAHWSQPAPRLHKLALHHFPIPPNPFDNVCPSLRDVEFVWCAFDWNTFPFSTITSLRVVNPDEPVGPDRFVQIMLHMPFLEVLDLEGALRDMAMDRPVSGLVRHHFPCLKSLDLNALVAPQLLDFLQMISILPHANVRVSPHQCGNLVPQVISELRTCQHGTSKKLSQFHLDVNQRMLSLETIGIPEDHKDTGTRFCCNLSQWEFDQTVVNGLFAYYDFSHLTELVLRSNEQGISNNIWTTIFTPLPHLVSLGVSGVYSSTFIDYFTPSRNPFAGRITPDAPIEDFVSDEVRKNVKYPSLKKLSLHRVGHYDADGDEEEMQWPSQFSMFCLALGVRCFVGCRIQELEIRRYSLSPKQVEQVEGVVDHLEYRKSAFSLGGLDLESDSEYSSEMDESE